MCVINDRINLCDQSGAVDPSIYAIFNPFTSPSSSIRIDCEGSDPQWLNCIKCASRAEPSYYVCHSVPTALADHMLQPLVIGSFSLRCRLPEDGDVHALIADFFGYNPNITALFPRISRA